MSLPAHITRALLEARYGALEVSRLESAGANIVAALDDANARIASYAPSPLTAAEPRLAWVGAAIARYQLYTVAPSEAVSENYKSAVAWLTAWAAGKVSLRDEMAQPTPPDADQVAAWLADGWDEYGMVWHSAEPRVLTAATLKAF